MDSPLDFVLAAVTPSVPLTSEGTGLVATVWELTWKGGIVMIPIAIASLVAIAYAIERAIVLRRGRVLPTGLIEEVCNAAQRSPSRALELCRARSSPLGRMLEAGLVTWNAQSSEIEKRLVEAGLREAVGLRNRLAVLGLVISISPMLGLLGTIFGMITAFRTVAESPEALGRTELLANGIYVALVTTAAGLLVALPVMLLYHALAARADQRVVELDAACRALLDVHQGRAAQTPPSTSPVAAPATADNDPAALIA